MFLQDINGLDRDARNVQLVPFTNLVEDMGLRRGIVNVSQLNLLLHQLLDIQKSKINESASSCSTLQVFF